MKMAEETFYDESSAIFIAKKICNVMSVSEPEACWHGYGERRMAIMNEVHDIMKENQLYDEKRYTQALRNMVQQCIDYEDTHEILTEWDEWGFSSRL